MRSCWLHKQKDLNIVRLRELIADAAMDAIWRIGFLFFGEKVRRSLPPLNREELES